MSKATILQAREDGQQSFQEERQTDVVDTRPTQKKKKSKGRMKKKEMGQRELALSGADARRIDQQTESKGQNNTQGRY